MNYVRLGKTGLKVSRLCLGMMSYGNPQWRDWVLGIEESRPFVKRALDAGINFFDTADVYSQGVSEEVTGKLLKEMTRNGSAYDLAAIFGVKEVLDPRETRAYLAEMLDIHALRLSNGVGRHLLANWPTSY